jgi:EAL domain-containing protein (putative c-di-GMP-specific phosphodiesterase class I)
MKEYIEKRVALRNSLYRAVERNELVLHYQPQVNAQTGELAGFEALLRWNSTEFGMVSPGEFIPIAEQTGLIKNIGDWVLGLRAFSIKNGGMRDTGICGCRLTCRLSSSGIRVL